MTPAQAIAALDRQLAAHGAALTIRRYVAGGDTYVDLALRGVVRGDATAQVVGDAQAVQSAVILSPTPFLAAGAAWPGAAGGESWPRQGDFLVVAGAERTVEVMVPRLINTTIVRFDGRVA